MATALSNLLALLALDNSSYMDGLKHSQKAADTFGGNLATVGGAVVLGALTAAATAVIGIGSAAFDAAETLDEAYDKIAVATGAMGPELDVLKATFDEVFAAIPTDAMAVADVFGVLNSRLGLTDDLLREVAIPLLEVTRLLGGDAKANAELFTRVMGDWSIPVDKAAGTLDKLFVAAQQTGVPIDSLMEQIVQYGAPLRNFGFSFEQAGGLLAKFASEGVNTEIVMSGMRIAQGKFIKSGVDMQTGLWDTVDAIKNATDKTDGLALATEIFGAKAAGDMYDTIIAGKLDIDGLTESMLNADGAILDAAAATSDWGEKWKIFQNKMTLALGPLGEKLREGMGKALDELVVVFERPDVQAAIERFTTFAVTTLTKIAEYIPTLITKFSEFVTFLQNNEPIIIGVFAALGVAALAWAVVTAHAAWLAVLPMLPVIAYLLIVAAYAYLLYTAWTNNWGGIQEKVAEVWAVLQPIFQNLWSWLQTNIPVAIQTASGAIQSIVGFFSGLLGPSIMLITETFALLQPQFSSAWAVMKEALVSFWNITKPIWVAVGGVILTVLAVIGLAIAGIVGFMVALISGVASGMAKASAFFGNIVIGISNILAGVTNVIGGVLEFIGGLFTLNGEKILEGLSRVGGGIWQIIVGTFQFVQNYLSAVLLYIVGFVEGFVKGVIAFFTSLYNKLVGHSIVPDMMKAILSSFTTVLSNIIKVVAGWVTTVIDKFKEVASKIVENFKSLSDFWTKTLQPVLEKIKDWVGDKVAKAFGTLSGYIETVTDWLGKLTKKLDNIKLPKWMTPGSPTPWEMGLRGVSQVMRELTNASLPTFQAALSLQTQPVAAGGIASGAGGNTGNGDMLVMEEIRRMLRDLPNEIARATTSAAAKMPRSR